ncbi:MAG: hypothetical protein IJL70_01370 [Treponema sp.]|nr:hypothetical protein [Treponema sp.]
MSTRNKIFLLTLLITAALLASCKRASKIVRTDIEWQKYTYKDYNGYLYTSFEKNKMNGLLCADVAGIKGRLEISHDCTKEQYQNLKFRLQNSGATWLCQTQTPDIAEYPDLSMYLTFVISSDELHEIWKNLGLE